MDTILLVAVFINSHYKLKVMQELVDRSLECDDATFERISDHFEFVEFIQSSKDSKMDDIKKLDDYLFSEISIINHQRLGRKG